MTTGYMRVAIYPWNGIMPDGAPILVRDTSTDEIYALDVQWP